MVNAIILFFLMLFCHIFDDFYLQGILADMKQKSYWDKCTIKLSIENRRMYMNDYKIAIIIHALSWGISINLPIFIVLIISRSIIPNMFGVLLLAELIINILIHAMVDNEKANKKSINLIQDQLIHFSQVFITFIIWCIIFSHFHII